MKLTFRLPKKNNRRFKGGAGSGNFGHAGRPGKRGGSAPSGGGGGSYKRGELANKYPKVHEVVLAGRIGGTFSREQNLKASTEARYSTAEQEISKLSSEDFLNLAEGEIEDMLAVEAKLSTDTVKLLTNLFETGYP